MDSKYQQGNRILFTGWLLPKPIHSNFIHSLVTV